MTQVQKAFIMRLYDDEGNLNVFTMPDEDPMLEASWTERLAATDGTKVVITPLFGEPSDEPGAAREYGGGNTTPGGIAYVIGYEPTAFTGRFDRVDQATIKALKELRCEKLGVVLVGELGELELIKKGEGATAKYYPRPIQKFSVSDKAHGGYDGVDYNSVGWNYPANSSDDLVIIKPTEFNPLDLKNPTPTVNPEP